MGKRSVGSVVIQSRKSLCLRRYGVILGVVRRGDGVRVAPGAVDATLANRQRSRDHEAGATAAGHRVDGVDATLTKRPTLSRDLLTRGVMW